MLVLSRKAEQSVLIGNDVIVTVLGVEGDRVKLGIEAPRSVTVLRLEVFEQLRSANTGAGAPTDVQSVAAALRRRGHVAVEAEVEVGVEVEAEAAAS